MFKGWNKNSNQNLSRTNSLIFKGWIPTVSGNLSFREIGTTKRPPSKICVNNVNPDFSQSIKIFGEKKSNDGILSHSLRPILEKFQTTVYFGLWGKSEDDPTTPYEKRDTIKGICYYTLDVRAHNEITSFEFKEAENYIINDATGLHSKAEFTIQRNGECTITPIGVTSSNIAESLKQFNQLFFIIKDLCHHHYHHDPESDSITELYEVTKKDCERWKYQTLYSLHRAIVSARRFKSEPELRKALGIGTYATTFELKFLPAEKDKLKYNSAEAIQSLSILIDEEKKSTADNSALLAIFISTFLAALALSIGLHQIKPYSDKDSGFKDFGKNIVDFALLHPFITGFIAAMLACIIQLQLNKQMFALTKMEENLSYFTARLAFFKKDTQAKIWLVISAILLLLTAILFSILLKHIS